MTALTKPVARETTTTKGRRRVIVTLMPDGEGVIKMRPKGLRFAVSLTVGQAYDHAAKLAGARLAVLKKDLKRAKKAEQFADVLRIEQAIKALGK